MKSKIKEYVPQVLLIVFSVVLGLYLNQKLVNNNEQRAANQLLGLVLEEVKSNRKIMANWYPYHDSMKLHFKKLKNDDDFVDKFIAEKQILFDTLFTRGSFLQRTLSNSAWEIAKSNSLISKIDFENMKLLADVYGIQKVLFDPAFDMFDIYYTTGINNEKVAKESLNNMYFKIQETVSREVFYLQTCDTALAKIIVDK